MRKISRRDALFVLGAPACAAAPQIAGRAAAGGELPPGVKAVWDLAKAYRESTATRERLSINGLWRWQPAGREGDAAPDGGWGYLRVPESWPDGAQGPGDTTLFFRHPDWAKKDLAGVTAAWQQREVTVPGEWSGRRIKLSTAYLNSYAAVYVDGKKAGEMRYPAGEIDLTALCRTGRKHTIGMFVMALPLKGVMLSYNNTASAMLVAAGATVVGNGVLARAEGANVVFSQLAPWQFDYSGEKMNVKRTFRRVACLSARLLANMGAARGTPLVARFADPAGAGEKRWLDGLYLDVPEEWDDPYRFFRW